MQNYGGSAQRLGADPDMQRPSSNHLIVVGSSQQSLVLGADDEVRQILLG